MERIEKLKEAIKERIRLTLLSALFLLVTTFVSCFGVYLPNWLWPHKYTAFDLSSTIIGSFFGQVTLLAAMSVINILFKKPDKPEELPAKLESIKDLTDLDPDQK